MNQVQEIGYFHHALEIHMYALITNYDNVFAGMADTPVQYPLIPT